MGTATCIYAQKPRDVLDDIADAIEKQFKDSPVNGGLIASQPGTNTLRGDETNFYVVANKQTFDITMLGQKVRIVGTPVSFTWNYGDGSKMGPTEFPGAQLPQDRWGEQTRTSHVFTATGDYIVTETTQFTGTYSVNGSPALPIPGQGSFPSNSLPISVWRAVTKSYADDCLENPDGVGC